MFRLMVCNTVMGLAIIYVRKELTVIVHERLWSKHKFHTNLPQYFALKMETGG